MELSSIRKSISEMSTDELHEQIRQMRQRRRERPERTAKTAAKSKKIEIPASPNLAELIKAMEAMVTSPPVMSKIKEETSTELKSFNVWLEGYAATGERAGATFKGTWSGTSFKNACANWVASLPKDQQSYYDADRNTYWNCRFFDNERDARECYG